ncbi:MAG TPA: CoA pyrophosphatase [Microthrixaceae bacterium]|nr:CoA pyrophosphatase [Microthrixaceae bacterium]
MSEARPRGGAQIIPRPDQWRPGPEAPWVDQDPGTADLGLDRIRSVFSGRSGAPSPVELDGARRSAVLAAFFEIDARTQVLLTRRTWDVRTHRGEVSFPGGGEEPGDGHPVATALREAHEEVALDPSTVEVVGELDHLSTVSSDRFIVPIVGILAGPPRGLVPQPSEVDAILEVPVADLLEPGVHREERWGPTQIDHPVHFFEIEGDTIWGATAAMLRQFLLLMLSLEPSGYWPRR